MKLKIPISMNPDLSAASLRLAWALGLFVTAMFIISAVDRRADGEAMDLLVKVEPLDDDRFLIKDKEVKKLIVKRFETDLIGEALSRIDPASVESVLLEEPFIRDAEVYYDAQNRIRVHVTQRRPLLRIMDSNGLNYYLDEEGKKMPVSKHYAARVIVATGTIAPYTPEYLTMKSHILKDLFFLANYILKDDFLHPLVEQIHVAKGEFILIPKLGDQKIVLGNLEMLDDKIERVKVFYQEGLTREGWQKYERIDVRFSGQVVAGK